MNIYKTIYNNLIKYIYIYLFVLFYKYLLQNKLFLALFFNSLKTQNFRLKILGKREYGVTSCNGAFQTHF